MQNIVIFYCCHFKFPIIIIVILKTHVIFFFFKRMAHWKTNVVKWHHGKIEIVHVIVNKNSKLFFTIFWDLIFTCIFRTFFRSGKLDCTLTFSRITLELLGPLCNQTDNLETESKTLYYWLLKLKMQAQKSTKKTKINMHL